VADTNLSEREMEILKLLVDGLDYKSIADKLFIAPNTVRKHISNIYEKLHVSSKAQAIKVAVKKRWV
jgi:DNA-binding NarL/FixJ family response regulator